MGFWNKLVKFSKQALKLVPAFIAVASVITAATPNPVDDGIVLAIHKALDIIALNVANNSQPTDVDK